MELAEESRQKKRKRNYTSRSNQQHQLRTKKARQKHQIRLNINQRRNIRRHQQYNSSPSGVKEKLQRILPHFKLHNLTNKILTEDEQLALCQGPNMIVPRPASKQSREAAAVHIKSSIEKVIRSIQLRILFSETPSKIPSPYRVPNPGFDPSPHVQLEPLVHDYIKKLRDRVDKYLASQAFKNTHLSTGNRVPSSIVAAWRCLLDNPDIRICKADKNLGLCLVDTTWYVGECLRHLNDHCTYHRVDWEDKDQITTTVLQGLNSILEAYNTPTEMKKYIEQDYDHGKVLSLCGFYILPKIHKPGPLKGRPICPNPHTPLYYASKYLHSRLKPFMLSASTYLKCSLDFIRQLSTLSVPATCYIITADVESLYPSIPINDETFSLIRELLMTECHDPDMCMKEKEIPFIMHLLEYVLSHNYVSFQGKIFRQISGTAMGTPVAVTFACLFMRALETNAHKTAIAQGITPPLLIKRYIDDYCFIFHCHESAPSYLSLINNMHPNIRLNYTTSFDTTTNEERAVPFLDLEIFKVPQSHFLLTRLYRKPQNAYLYLLPWSFHPPHIFANFIKSELTRIRTACSLDEDCTASRHFFRQRLKERGYSDGFLDPIFASHQPSRNSVLNRPPRVQRNPGITLVVEYNVHTATAPLKQLLRPGWALFARRSAEIFGTCNNDKARPYIAFTVQQQLYRALNHQVLPPPTVAIRLPRVSPRGPFRLRDEERERERQANAQHLSHLHTPNTQQPDTSLSLTTTDTSTHIIDNPHKRARTDL